MYIREIVSSSTKDRKWKLSATESESLALRNRSEVSRSLVLQSKWSVKKLGAIKSRSQLREIKPFLLLLPTILSFVQEQPSPVEVAN